VTGVAGAKAPTQERKGKERRSGKSRGMRGGEGMIKGRDGKGRGEEKRGGVDNYIAGQQRQSRGDR